MELVFCQMDLSKRVQERVNETLTFFGWQSCISKLVTELPSSVFWQARAGAGKISKGFSGGRNDRKHRMCRDNLSNETKMKIYTKNKDSYTGVFEP